MGGLVRATRLICQCIRALWAGEQTACRFAVAYALRLWLGGFFRGCTLFRFNEKDFRDGGLQVRTLHRKRKRSGERFAHQVGRRMQSQACLVPRTVCGCTPDAVCRGGSLGREPPP